MKKVVLIILMCSYVSSILNGQQKLSLPSLLDSVKSANPILKMYDNDIRSMDEAAKGARNWMPLELGTGLWMVPYNVNRWKKMDDGMGGQRKQEQGGKPGEKPSQRDDAHGQDEPRRSDGNMASLVALQ